MAWLTGWDYRKSHVINPANGAGEDYQMRIKTYYPTLKYFINNGWNATFHNWTHPPAFYYNGKTYVAYMGGGKSDPWITCYDHSTGLWANPVKIANSPIPTDNHGSPSIVIDANGYIHVFYGCHSSPIIHAKSNNPEDISAWTVQATIGNGMSYPMPVKDNTGILYLFARGTIDGPSYPTQLSISNNNGSSWSAFQTIIEASPAGSDIYIADFVYDATNGRIHLTWNIKIGTVIRNVYHAYYKISDGHLYSMSGEDLGIVITTSEADTYCKVFDSDGKDSQGSHIALDSDGSPFIVFAYKTNGDYSWDKRTTRWDGSNWTTPVTVMTNEDFPIGAIFVTSGIGANANLELYMREYNVSPSEIRKYTSNNGGATWGTPTIILAAEGALDLVYVWRVENYQLELKIVFAEHDTVTKAYAYGSGGLVKGVFPDAVGLNSHCRTDFGDVRFTDNDGSTLLNYWMESKVDGDYAIFWVKVADSLESSAQTIYVYYGKADATYPYLATEKAHGEATFLFFDDFEDESLDAKWTVVSGSPVEASGYLRVSADIVRSTNTIPAGHRQKARVRLDALTIYSQFAFSVQLDDSEYQGIWCAIAGTLRSTTYDGGTSQHTENLFTPQLNTWYNYAYEWYVLGGVGQSTKFYIDNVLKATHTTGIPDLAPYVRFVSVVNNPTVDIDWVFVSKYVSPEPTHGAWGSEESSVVGTSTSSVMEIMMELL